MEYSFPHYLLAKQSVDDRALNRHVLETLKSAISASPLDPLSPSASPRLSVTEVGAGIGTMLVRLLRWGLLQQAVYTLVDELPENLDYAAAWIPAWAAEHGLRVEKFAPDHLRLWDDAREVEIRLVCADVFDFIQRQPAQSDLLIAHAFLDLLPMPASLEKLFSLLKPGGLAWLTVNFDGVTTLEPSIRFSVSESARAPASPLDPLSASASPLDPLSISASLLDPLSTPFRPLSASVSPFRPLSSSVDLDAQIERLYHQTMDTRPTGGDSQAGRHLFGHLRAAGAEILAAGPSDWVVYAVNGQYPADEAYFLHFILHFFESSLGNHPELDPQLFQRWLAERRAQVERGELVYIAHQMDFLAKT